MDAELAPLEQKILLIANLCQSLRAENQKLRQQLAAAQGENRLLANRIQEAKGRIETLLERIPEDAA
jgi:cell division protein ZapB